MCSVLLLTLTKLSVNAWLWLFVEFAFTQYYPLSLLVAAFFAAVWLRGIEPNSLHSAHGPLPEAGRNE